MIRPGSKCGAVGSGSAPASGGGTSPSGGGGGVSDTGPPRVAAGVRPAPSSGGGAARSCGASDGGALDRAGDLGAVGGLGHADHLAVVQIALPGVLRRVDRRRAVLGRLEVEADV